MPKPDPVEIDNCLVSANAQVVCGRERMDRRQLWSWPVRRYRGVAYKVVPGRVISAGVSHVLGPCGQAFSGHNGMFLVSY
mgnify:CR=1 FL=1